MIISLISNKVIVPYDNKQFTLIVRFVILYSYERFIFMCTITATELKKNLGKYMILGQTEEIEVTNRGKVVFYITPERIKLMDKLESLFGCLPREAYYDNDIDRE